MNAIEIQINEKRVIIFDAPPHVVHGNVLFFEGARYNVSRKTKVKDSYVFDKTNTDGELEKFYEGRIVNVGMVSGGDESLVADLFTPVKRGNFYDYEYNGIFYPRAIDALKDIIDQETGFKNPFVLIINPK